ncbi:MAG: hypothetical protein CL424_00055 [Acidimicrobiaceae bacterium]|nr:hypothetical protein [Acidimicrobiaceae bacterium]
MSTSGDPHPTPGEPAVAVDTLVSEDRGRWIVEIVVVFPDGVVRRRINDYPTERHARIAAGWVRQSADRNIEGPLNG